MRLNIEPLSKNSFILLFDLKSGECEDKKKKDKPSKMMICLFRYPERDLNPHSRIIAKGF